MPRKHITQEEAHKFKRRAEELEQVLSDQRNAWAREYPGGVHIASLAATDVLAAQIHVARKLEHAVVVTLSGSQMMFYAVPAANGGA